MFNRRNRRGGFTLPEVLVTVAIVAVLAAVVVPAVTQQLSKADAPSLQSSISNLRTGVTAFVTDVRKFPRRLSHLSNAITATDSSLAANLPFGNGSTNQWRGPYMSFAISRGDSVSLGMNLKGFDSLSIASNMVKMDLTGVTDTMEIHVIDSLIDGKTGQAAGSLRWTPSGTSVTLLHYLLVGSR